MEREASPRASGDRQEGRRVVPYQIIHTPVPPQLIRAAEDILEGVRSGEITGLGVVVTLKRRRFFVDAFGELVRDPHGARGWVASLDDCLRDIGNAKHGSHTTI